jgi:hypothetical protein
MVVEADDIQHRNHSITIDVTQCRICGNRAWKKSKGNKHESADRDEVPENGKTVECSPCKKVCMLKGILQGAWIGAKRMACVG